ncbi:MAG: hypothetical protein U1G07_17435 [Verrucomicrobiota bacterium]
MANYCFLKRRGFFSGVLILLACLVTPRQASGIAGLEGTFEFGLDAPWRIEPSKKSDGTLEYGAIPIQISIHGGMDAGLDDIIYYMGGGIHLPPDIVSLGSFYSIRIKELGPEERPTLEFPLSALHEIELMVGTWPYPHNPSAYPQYRLCRLWKGDDPEPFRKISNTSEWHGTLWYVPYTKRPGASVALQIEVILQRPELPPVQVPGAGSIQPDLSPFITLRNFVRVYLAPEPLPRFDSRWLYGDMHYHSQGTDNEGEAGYNYRGVVRAMGAMGLDFLFATDHASSSEQIIDADLPPIDDIVEIAHDQGDVLKEKDVRSRGGVLRDMNEFRFAFAHQLIHSASGVNQEATLHAGELRFPQNYQSYRVVPQVYLGGEVDVIPEVKKTTVDNFVPPGTIKVGLPYGNGLVFDLGNLCAPMGCSDPRGTLLGNGDPLSYVVHDFQSLESFDYFGRLHMVYFPSSSSLTIGSESAFIPSYTSRFGGATRRLDHQFEPAPEIALEPMLPEVERKGVVFVAHHLAGGSSRGPDLIPWTTDHLLLKAFKSRAVLGLEFWNEDTRYRTRVCSHDYCRPNGGSLGVFLGQEHGYERHEKLEAETGNPFVDLLLKFLALPGIEFNALPEDFRHMALPLEEARRGFVQSGPGSGLFELIPFDVVGGYWQDRTYETEHTLHHGAYDWDIMNLRGLAFEENAEITAPRGWLQPGEPRRLFMGGGSDAHGDFNYRRAGYFLGTEDANDTAIGKPRNLVYAGVPEGPVIYHEDPPVVERPVGEASLGPGGERAAASLNLPASTAIKLASLGKLPIDRKPPVKDPIFDPGTKPPVVVPPTDPIVDPDPGLPPVDPPVTRPPDAAPPTDPVVDPNPPPDTRPPDAAPPTDPIVDPDPGTPPDTRPPDAVPPKDPILDPGTPPVTSPGDRPPDAAPPTDPIVDPGAGDPDPPTKPPVFPPGDAVNLGLNVRVHTQEQIVRALQSGRFCVTDGPAIRIAIDRNGNQKIDDEDVQMGSVFKLVRTPSGAVPGQEQTVTLLTEVVSTAEFGPIMDMDVYVGAQPAPVPPGPSKPVEPRLYAPLNHGPQGFRDDAIHSPQRAYSSHNRTYVRKEDNYWNGDFLGDSLTWNQVPGESLQFTHTLVTTLVLDKYEVGEGVTADRFFVRAFARTAGDTLHHIPDRYAYANPIWILRTDPQLAPPVADPETPPPADPGQADPVPVLTAARSATGGVVLTFTGTLQQTADLSQPFQDVPAAASPFTVPAEQAASFFRVRQ